MADLDRLSSRLAVLETRISRLRVVAMLSFGVAATAVGLTLRGQSDTIVEGRLWLAKDDQGRTRAMFGVTNDGVALTMYDSTGQMRLDVGLTQHGAPGLVMLTNRGEPALTLNLSEGSGPTVRMIDPAAQTRLELGPRLPGATQFGPTVPPDTSIARRVEP
ncbi:MAG: hypothetical protein KF785_02535 [Gemmatimonadales bacterium]|nr:hypothetical protein [Gemmatimonadales bacterium]